MGLFGAWSKRYQLESASQSQWENSNCWLTTNGWEGNLRLATSNFLIFFHNSCFSTITCRGIHHDLDGDTCYLLYDTTDVPENERSNYNVTSLTADGKKTILVKGSKSCLNVQREKRSIFQFIYCSIPPRYSAILIEIPIAFHIPDRKSDPVRLGCDIFSYPQVYDYRTLLQRRLLPKLQV